MKYCLEKSLKIISDQYIFILLEYVYSLEEKKNVNSHLNPKPN